MTLHRCQLCCLLANLRALSTFSSSGPSPPLHPPWWTTRRGDHHALRRFDFAASPPPAPLSTPFFVCPCSENTRLIARTASGSETFEPRSVALSHARCLLPSKVVDNPTPPYSLLTMMPWPISLSATTREDGTHARTHTREETGPRTGPDGGSRVAGVVQ